MRLVEPKVFVLGETQINEDELGAYLEHIGAPNWASDAPSDAEELIEVMGRACYRSFGTDLNPNVTRVRESNYDYLRNILKVKHGSVLEHCTVNFMFADVSRVFTHELVRHRVGTAISQESLRFVRLEDLGFWPPLVVKENEEVLELMSKTFEDLGELQIKLAGLYDLDNPDKDFGVKKKATSAMRRVAPIGLATSIGWTANLRTIRLVLEARTNPGAEEEIRLVFSQVGKLMKEKYPNLFGDYYVEHVDGYDWYKTDNPKV